jgi:hypothetical protein
MVPVTAVPLAVPAVLLLAKWLGRLLPGERTALLAVGLTVVVVAATGGLYLGTHTTVLAGHYTQPPDRLIDQREQDLFARIKTMIPPIPAWPGTRGTAAPCCGRWTTARRCSYIWTSPPPRTRTTWRRI